MKARDIARSARVVSGREALRTRATYRGVVDSVNTDGTAQIILPNGAEIKVHPSNLFKFSADQSVTLLKSSNHFEVLGPSGYGGGNGSPFSTP